MAAKKQAGGWKNRIVNSGEMAAGQFLAHELNARRHPAIQRDALRGSLDALGWVAPVIVSKRSGKILDGHARVEEALSRSEDAMVPYVEVDVSASEEKLILASYDPITGLAVYDREILDALLKEVNTDEAALQEMLSKLAQQEGVIDFDRQAIDGNGGGDEAPKVTLSDRFIIPPFSVLDARQGYWQDRKRAWIALGIQSELGRGDTVLFEAEQVTTEGLNYDSNLAKKGSARMANAGMQSDPNMLRIDEYRQSAKVINAAPGASLRPAMKLENGKTVRGDGKGRPMGKTNKLAPGGTGANSAYIGVRTPAVEARYAKKGLARSSGQDLMRGEHEVVNSRSPAFRPNKDLPEETQRKLGGYMASGAVIDRAGGGQSGTSIFDPVLCELAYRWFSPSGGAIFDPFAGGSVRGIVAAYLDRHYTGVDLRAEQVAANEAQAAAIVKGIAPRWIVGDSRLADEIAKADYDFIFSCPPYFDLEVYSDDPADLSTLKDYKAFLDDYRGIIAKAVAMLKPDRFACFVVGDVRDKKGLYRNFVSDTVAAFQDAGAMLYNEAILVTSVGSLPIRVGRQFEAGRKLGKTHQNVLVFIKGDAKKATQACGIIDYFDPAEQFGEVAQ
jgi:hypothetical protein